jgi:membrane protease YdiL (CAAX protease family)
MWKNKKYKIFAGATLCSFALMVFSYFIHFRAPIFLISLAALTVPAYFFSRNLHSPDGFKKAIGESATFKKSCVFCIAGILSGILLSMFYRWYLEISLIPVSMNYFVIVAALIGALEEIVFRGFIQEYVKSINATFSIFFSTISHTGYKCCLFLSPMAAAGIDVVNLAFWTFLIGILAGTVKQVSKSVFPSLLAHALFDIIVYAEFVKAPWWVW